MIMSNGMLIRGFEDFKKLTKEEREFYIFTQLSKLDHLDKKYAGKRVEIVVYGFISLVLLAFGGALVGVVFR